MHRFGILEAIPRNGSASYEDIAAKTRLHPVHLRRLLRLSMATGFFDETEDGKVCHNACSVMLLSRPHLLDIVGFMSELTVKASTRLIDAMERDPLLQEPNTTGFNLAFQTDENFLLHLESNPKAAAMFGGTMKGMANNPGFSHDHMVRGYNWEELGTATVVDVCQTTLNYTFPFLQDLQLRVQELTRLGWRVFRPYLRCSGQSISIIEVYYPGLCQCNGACQGQHQR